MTPPGAGLARVEQHGVQRELPHNLEAEQAVLGALLIEETAFGLVADQLKAEDFYLQAHQLIFVACADLAHEKRAIDPILLHQRLEAKGLLGAVVPRELPFGLAKGLGTIANVRHYAESVAELAQLRRLILAGAEISQQGFAAAARVPEYAAQSIATLTAAAEPRRASDTAGELGATLSLARALEQEEEALEEGTRLLPTGWPRLDRALGGGFGIPSLNVLGAAPKSGKSMFAQIIAERHAMAGGFVYYLDLENGRRRFVRRMLCRRAQLGSTEVASALRDHERGVFSTRSQVDRWNSAKAWLDQEIGRNLLVEFEPPRDFQARVANAASLAGSRPLLVVVDSLQKLPMGDMQDRRGAVDSWLRLFERLRHKHSAVFFVISEIKRNGRGEYEANESAFKESGGIEYSADLAMTLTRPRADEGAEPVSTLRIELARDCDEDPRGEVASYAPVRPFYGLEETEPVISPKAARRTKPRGPAPAKGSAARDFLTRILASGPVASSLVSEAADDAGISRTTLQDTAKAMGIIKEGGTWRVA